MGFFSIFRPKPNSEELELSIKEFTFPDEEMAIEEEGIVSICEGNVIDTSLSINLAKYKHNISYLQNQALITGDPGKMVIIREDNFLPDDFVWRCNRSDTYGEYVGTHISYEMRNQYARDLSTTLFEKQLGFAIPKSGNELERENEILKQFGCNDGLIYAPVHFRSTKHFTVNTPLGFTGDYNAVSVNRKYTIIDSADNFLNSGYGYSFAGRDAYLDVTHEGLKISDSAIILISEEYFNSIKNDNELMSKLNTRRLIVYRGELDAAINMVMSEMGILPFRPGLGIPYNEDIASIIEEKLISINEKYDMEYNKSHGGLEGHFSNQIDLEMEFSSDVLDNYAAFLNERAGLDFKVTSNGLRNNSTITAIVKKVGARRLIDLTKEYNELAKRSISDSMMDYKSERDNISKEDSDLFKEVISLLKEYFRVPENSREEIWPFVMGFYGSKDIGTQLLYASKIKELLGRKIER